MELQLDELFEISKGWLLSSGLRIVLILVVGYISYRILRLIVDRSVIFVSDTKREEEMGKRAKTLNSLLKKLISVSIFVIVLVMILGEFGVQLGPILAAAGVVGIAIGFGAQRLVEDVISGFFILLENQVRIGDVIETAGQSGVVEKVGLRSIILRDLNGNVHFIRNGKIDIISNMTKEYSRYVFNIGVAYKEDVDQVMSLIRQVDEDLRADPEYADDILEPLDILGLDQFADSALIIKARIKTKPIKQWKTAREFNRRLKKIFDANDIEIPFPHVTLYMGQDKDKRFTTLNVTKDN